MNAGSLILSSLALPIAGALTLCALGRFPALRNSIPLATSSALFILVSILTIEVMDGNVPEISLFEFAPGLPFAFKIEPLGALFALLSSFLWIVTTVYSIGYLRANHEKNRIRYHTYFCLSLASSIGIAFASNMLTLFFFYEALTLCTYPLVTHSGTDAARRGGRRYLIILLSTSIALLLLAILWTWVATGTLTFKNGGILSDHVSSSAIAILFVLYIFGIGKAALVPFHGWLPAAMVAPAPVSALLHAVAVVKAGVFTVVKVIIYIFGLDVLRDQASSDWLLYVAGATILFASLMALRQIDLKRRLAYSTVSQLSYIVIGATMANSYALMGSTLHIVMHGFAKITLFFCAGAIFTVTKKTRIDELDGIGKKMPITMGAFAVGSFALIGLPPFAGAWSKYYLVLGTLQENSYPLLALLLISSLLNAFYFLPIVVRAFFPLKNRNTSSPNKISEAPILMIVAITITTLGCFVLFAYPNFLFNLLYPLIEY